MILGLHPIKYSLIQLAFDLKVLAALNWQTTRTYQMPCSKWNIFLARSCHIELLCPSVGSLYHFKIRIQAKLSYADIEMTSQLRFQKRILIIEVAAHMLEKEIHTEKNLRAKLPFTSIGRYISQQVLLCEASTIILRNNRILHRWAHTIAQSRIKGG